MLSHAASDTRKSIFSFPFSIILLHFHFKCLIGFFSKANKHFRLANFISSAAIVISVTLLCGKSGCSDHINQVVAAGRTKAKRSTDTSMCVHSKFLCTCVCALIGQNGPVTVPTARSYSQVKQRHVSTSEGSSVTT